MIIWQQMPMDVTTTGKGLTWQVTHGGMHISQKDNFRLRGEFITTSVTFITYIT